MAFPFSLAVRSLAVTAFFACSASAAEISPAAAEKQVDALLAKWDSTNSPGAAVEVIRDGKVILRKTYGMADIERGVRIAAATPFNVGSVSKQFTAFAIHLLAQEGKLGLDDDIRKHLPNAPEVGKTITIRQLLQHTSGLRDYINLLVLAGWRLDDVFTREDALSVIQRQRELNFAPGAEHLYSNTGYMLLALIVERTSGKPFEVFAKERIFDPLDMKNTFFQPDYAALVPGRALSYGATPGGGYKYVAMTSNVNGAGGVITTLDDLALWDRNFYDGKVGGKGLIEQMQLTGVLTNGKPLQYASGLAVGTYRGAKLVEHSGGIAGYRSQLTRFPDKHFTVAILANTSDISTMTITRRIADIYLDGELAPAPAAAVQAAPVEITLDPSALDAFVGYFELSPQFGITFTKEEGKLMAQATGQQKFPLFASSEREFFLKVVKARFTFDPPGADGVVTSVTLHQDGRAMPAQRTRKAEAPLDVLKPYEGEFYSEELGVLYKVAVQDGRLMLTHPRGPLELTRTGTNKFNALFPVGEVSFQCTQAAGCSGLTVTNGRVRNLAFQKVKLVRTAEAPKP